MNFTLNINIKCIENKVGLIKSWGKYLWKPKDIEFLSV